MEKGDALLRAFLAHPKLKRNGAVKRLEQFIKLYPTVFFLHEGKEEGTIELWYNVHVAKKTLRAAEDAVEIRAWERNLKHAGLKPLQTYLTPKKWVLRNDKVERNPLPSADSSELLVGHASQDEIFGQ